jgi:hypothetical protein
VHLPLEITNRIPKVAETEEEGREVSYSYKRGENLEFPRPHLENINLRVQTLAALIQKKPVSTCQNFETYRFWKCFYVTYRKRIGYKTRTSF